MNTNPENRYETYVVAEGWNVNPHAPRPLTNHITVDTAINAIKEMYGRRVSRGEGSAEDFLQLENMWGATYPELATSLFSFRKMTDPQKVEIGVDISVVFNANANEPPAAPAARGFYDPEGVAEAEPPIDATAAAAPAAEAEVKEEDLPWEPPSHQEQALTIDDTSEEEDD
jgi:hypothetical protein